MDDSKEVVIKEETQVAAGGLDWTPEQVQLVKDTICPGASDDEFKIFAHVAKRTGLDPFARQIYSIERKVKKKNPQTGQWDWGTQRTIQTGIDGFRLIADRTGKFAGIDDAQFEMNGDLPAKATITVYKFLQGERCPFTASARWSEYFPGEKSGKMWLKMPHTMLGKCAEALALRKAFPAELSGIYTSDEMSQANNNDGPAKQHSPNQSHQAQGPTKVFPTQDQIKRLFTMITNSPCWEESHFREFLNLFWRYESSKELSVGEYNWICDKIESTTPQLLAQDWAAKQKAKNGN